MISMLKLQILNKMIIKNLNLPTILPSETKTLKKISLPFTPFSLETIFPPATPFKSTKNLSFYFNILLILFYTLIS